jgi:tetratricopeptide (TPR) repeat protein
LKLAKKHADYLLFIDADEYLVFSPDFFMPDLNCDYYNVPVQYEDLHSYRILLASTRLDWKWNGVIHEAIECPKAKKGKMIDGVINLSTLDGHRSSSKDKALRDAKILEKELEDHPGNSRYVLHLAMTYDSANQYELALHNYEKRIEMGGDAREMFLSLYGQARMQERLQAPVETFITGYLNAFLFRKIRPEPLFELNRYFIKKEWFLLGFLLSRFAETIAFEDEYYATQRSVYDYEILCQLAECAFRIKKIDVATKALQKLLQVNNLPQNRRIAIESNLIMLRNDEKENLFKHDR